MKNLDLEDGNSERKKQNKKCNHFHPTVKSNRC